MCSIKQAFITPRAVVKHVKQCCMRDQFHGCVAIYYQVYHLENKKLGKYKRCMLLKIIKHRFSLKTKETIAFI